jgi:O-antigen/teichoic acid export membrane protein
MVILTASSVPVAGMLNAFRLRRDVALTQLGEKTLTLALLGGLVLAGSVTIPTVMACIALSSACWFLVRYKVYGTSAALNAAPAPAAQEESHDLVRRIIRQVTSYSIPFVGWGFIGWIQLSGERWIMGGLLSTSDVGRYGLGAALIQSSAVVAFNVLAQYVTPIIYEKYSDPDPQVRKQGLRIIKVCGWATLGIFAGSGFLFYIAGADIIRLISNRAFILKPELLLALTIGLGLFSVGQMMTTAGLAAQRPRIYMVPKIIAAVIALVAYTLGCVLAGIDGVVVAVVVTNGVYVLLVWWANRTHQVWKLAE